MFTGSVVLIRMQVWSDPFPFCLVCRGRNACFLHNLGSWGRKFGSAMLMTMRGTLGPGPEASPLTTRGFLEIPKWPLDSREA